MVKYILYPNGVSLRYETDLEEGEEILNELEESLGIPLPDDVAIVDEENIDKISWDNKSKRWIAKKEEVSQEADSESIPKLDDLPQIYYVWDTVTNKSSVMDILSLIKYGSMNVDHELRITKL